LKKILTRHEIDGVTSFYPIIPDSPSSLPFST